MGEYVKVSQEGRDLHLVVVKRYSDGTSVLVDFTECAEDAIRADGCENGRNFGFEYRDAVDYANYVKEYLTFENASEFDTRKYRMVVMKDGAVEKIETCVDEEEHA